MPFVAMSYEHKIIGLLETLGKQDCCVDITDTFANEDKENTTIEQIRKLLKTIGKDEVAQQKAKKLPIIVWIVSSHSYVNNNTATYNPSIYVPHKIFYQSICKES